MRKRTPDDASQKDGTIDREYEGSTGEEDDDAPSKRKKSERYRNVIPEHMNCTPDRVVMDYKVDGACRNNGKKKATSRSSIGVYPGLYKSKYIVSRQDPAATNQEAEIHAATAGVYAMIQEYEDTGCSVGNIFMDSGHVVSTVVSGRIEQYVEYGRENFNRSWFELNEALRKAARLGLMITFRWIPRFHNKEADELCNAALDQRPINMDVRSPTTIHEVSVDSLIDALQVCMKRRIRAPRTLSMSLVKPWIQFLQSIIMIENLTKARLLFWLAPLLLSVATQDIKSSSSFKAVRRHLEMLQDRTYLASCVAALATDDQQPTQTSPSTTNASQRFHTMVKRGLFLKAIESSNIKIAEPSPEVDAKLISLYPQNDLPPTIAPAPGYDSYSISFAGLATSLRRLKSGKSPGFSGWTRELLWPLFQSTTPGIQARIVELFSSMGNVDDLLPIERRLFQDGVLIPFEYIDRQGKIRPITLKETFGKIIWHTLIDEVYKEDNRLAYQSGQCFFREGGSASACHALQSALHDFPAVAHDSQNAFNSFNRAAGMNFIKAKPKIYGRGFKWFNLQYALPSQVIRLQDGFRIDVTSGSNQGCVSSSFFFTAATWYALRGISNISIVDDTYTIGKHFLKNSITMAERLAEIGLDITGPKTCILLPDKFEPMLQELLDNNEIPPYLFDKDGKVKVQTGIIHPLGSAIEIGDRPVEEMNYYGNKIVGKCTKRVNNLLSVEGSKQDKLLVLKQMSLAYQYYAETCLLAPHNHTILMETLDKVHHSCLCDILDLDIPQASSATPFLPTQGRGFGIVPYAHVGLQLRKRAALRAKPLCELLGIDLIEVKGSPDTNRLWSAWQDFARFNKVPKGRYTPKAWLDIRPLNQVLTLSDDEVDFYARFLLNSLSPIKYWCPLINNYLDTLNPLEFSIHMTTCSHCAAASNHQRHNAVRDQLSRTLRFYSISNTCEPADAQIEMSNGTLGRPDIRLHLHQPTYIDVATPVDRVTDANDMSTMSAVKQRFNNKVNKYKDEKEFTILPFVISCYGSTHTSSIAPFRRFEQDFNLSGLCSDILQNSIIALIKGMYTGFSIIQNRTSTYALFSHCNGEQREDQEKEKQQTNSKTNTKEKPKETIAPQEDLGHGIPRQSANQNDEISVRAHCCKNSSERTTTSFQEWDLTHENRSLKQPKEQSSKQE